MADVRKTPSQSVPELAQFELWVIPKIGSCLTSSMGEIKRKVATGVGAIVLCQCSW